MTTLQALLLRLKSQNDIKVSKRFENVTGPVVVLVEAEAVVEAQDTEHGQKYPQAYAGRALDIEWVEIAEAAECVAPCAKART